MIPEVVKTHQAQFPRVKQQTKRKQGEEGGEEGGGGGGREGSGGGGVSRLLNYGEALQSTAI